MSLGLDLGFGVNRGGGVQPDFALEFNGTDEYLSIALPNNELLASAGVTDFYSSGSAIAGWTETGTVAWNGAETGKTYTNTITMTGGEGTYSGISKTISGLIIGQKYKLKLRYKPMIAGIQELLIGSQAESTDYFVLSFDADTAEEWSTVSKIFTAVSTTIAIGTVSGIAHLDYASVKRDQGFDLNKDQEQILHSRNAEFNNAGCDWVAHGNHSFALSTVDKIGATGGSILITASGAGDETNNYVELPAEFIETCLRDKKYTIEGFGRSDTATTTLTFKLGSKSVTSGNLSTTAGTFTKAVLNMLATATEENVPLKAWLNKAANVYVDKLSLTQAYDLVIGIKVKSNGLTFIPVNFGIEYYLALGNITGGVTNERLTMYVRDPDAVSISQYATGTTSGDYLDGQFRNFIARLDRTNSLLLYTNGVKETTYYAGEQTPNHIGKMILTTALNITKYLSNYYAGQISHIQIWRFENIAQSTFNSAITGLQYPTGGGAEEVLRLTFQSGYNITECLKDYSPKNHTVTGVNVDMTNRKRVTT